MTVSKRIAVIGAGPSGLVTVKELLEEGHRPTCFERAASLGGVFRFGHDDGVVWESCRLSTSGLLTAFSDFPVPSEWSGHMKVGEYVDYLTRYGDAFGVGRHVRFGTHVDAVIHGPNGWIVRTHDAGGAHEETFDAVAVCSGVNQHPSMPKVSGQETFPGTVMHSSQYRKPTEVAGKRVLIVGAGESGADIVAEVAEHAVDTVLSFRRGVAVQRRITLGKPGDYRLSRIRNTSAHWIFQTRNPKDKWKRNLYRTVFLPLVIVDKALQVLYRSGWDILPLFRSCRASEIRANLKTRRVMKQLLADSGGGVTEQFGTKSDDFVRAIAAGRCQRASAIARFEGPRVFFEDGGQFQPDVVIFCTGFDIKMPFLEDRLAAAPRYLHTFNPQIGADVGFIGFLRPAFGAIPPLAELQARWFAQLQSGRLQLPTARLMHESIAWWTEYRAHVFRAVRGRLEHLVDYTPFCDALAEQVGCKPTRSAVRQESLPFRLRFFAAPFVAAQYRLVGPHAKTSMARDTILRLPIVHPVPELINLYLRWVMSRTLYRLMGSEFSPKLTLDDGTSVPTERVTVDASATMT